MACSASSRRTRASSPISLTPAGVVSGDERRPADAADTTETDLSRWIEETGGNLRAARDRADELRGVADRRFAAKFDLDLADEADAATVKAMVDAVIPTDSEVQVAVNLSRGACCN